MYKLPRHNLKLPEIFRGTVDPATSLGTSLKLSYTYCVCRRATARIRRGKSHFSTVLLHGHENGHSCFGNICDRFGGHLCGFCLSEKKYEIVWTSPFLKSLLTIATVMQ